MMNGIDQGWRWRDNRRSGREGKQMISSMKENGWGITDDGDEHESGSGGGGAYEEGSESEAVTVLIKQILQHWATRDMNTYAKKTNREKKR